jgi:hypothetical protein
MLRLKETILNEPEFWLTLLRIPPQALGRSTRAHMDACGQSGITSRRGDGRSENSEATPHAGDLGFKCKV